VFGERHRTCSLYGRRQPQTAEVGRAAVEVAMRTFQREEGGWHVENFGETTDVGRAGESCSGLPLADRAVVYDMDERLIWR